jgi:putative colanic acid biosynthesis acetyltransferase WcaF
VTNDPQILVGPATGIAVGGPSFALQHRLFRAAWQVSWTLLAAWTPPPLHRWRRLVLMAFGATMHPSAKVHSSARVWYPPNLRMEARAVLGPRSTCYCVAPVVLEEGAIVSQGAHLCGATHAVDGLSFQLVAKPIVIGKGAWIAAEAFVGPGVTAKEGAVLGARGVAFGDLEPHTIYIGNPARALRARGRQVD